MMGMRTVRFTIILGLCSLVACKNNKATEISDLSAPTVTCQVLQAHPMPIETILLGKVIPCRSASIAAKINGTIAAVNVILGQHVVCGEELVTLNAREYYANAQQARAQADQAAADDKRAEALYAQGAITESARDELRNRHRTLQAAAEGAEVSAQYAHILAPFDGTITKKMVQTGDLAIPGSILLQLDDLSRYQVEVHMPEDLKHHLTIGQTLEVCLEKTSVQAKMIEITPVLDPVSRTFLAKAELPATTTCYAGQCVRVRVLGASSEKLLLPETAVRRSGQLESVFVYHEGSAEMRLIKTIPYNDGYVEITGGLQAGEHIVIQPNEIQDGQRVVEAKS